MVIWGKVAENGAGGEEGEKIGGKFVRHNDWYFNESVGCRGGCWVMGEMLVMEVRGGQQGKKLKLFGARPIWVEPRTGRSANDVPNLETLDL